MSTPSLDRPFPRGFGEAYGSRPHPATEIKIQPLGVDLAFPRLFRLLRRDWDTGAGLAVRRLCWSLFNQQSPPVGLWFAVAELDQGDLREFARLLELPPGERERRVDELLTGSGEKERIDRFPLYTARQDLRNGPGQLLARVETGWPGPESLAGMPASPREKGGPEA